MIVLVFSFSSAQPKLDFKVWERRKSRQSGELDESNVVVYM